MSNATLAALSEEQVRDAINRWSTGYFRIPNLGDKIFLDEIAPHSSYTFRLQTQYEERTVNRESEPYGGGPVDDRGRPPGPWEMPARRPTDFEDRTETFRVPHTEQVTMCSSCAGLGRVDCKPCDGTGRANCTHCQGKGYREETEFQKDTDPHGNQTTRPVTVKKDCTHCHNGKVTCTACNGNGRVTCPGCKGSGRVKTFDRLTVRFHCPAQSEVHDATAVPDEMLKRLTGEVLFDQQVARIDDYPGAPAEAAERARGMLRKSHAVDDARSRLLFQHLHVERVPVQEVKYRYAGVSYTMWICGNEREVHAPTAPWRSGRMWGILGGVLLGVVALAAVVALLLFAFGR